MKEGIELNQIQHQETGYTRITYIQILFRGREVGFISPEGIFLRMYNTCCEDGVLRPIAAPETNDVNELKRFFIKHFDAINDRYVTVFRSEQ